MSLLETLKQMVAGDRTIRLQEYGWMYRPGTWPRDILTSYELVSGHIPFSNIQSEMDAHYITLLRNPIDQVISHYWQIRRPVAQDQSPKEEKSVKLIDFNHNKSLAEVINDKESGINSYIDNIQTRMLGWIGPCTDSPPLTETQWNELLENAKSRLVNEFTFFGITDFMESTLQLLMKTFSIKQLKPVNKVVNKRLPHQKDPVLPDTAHLIANQNKYDVQLYKYALKHFQLSCQKNGIQIIH